MDPKREAMISKIMKLLELSKEENNGTDGERENAGRMAAKLMADYSLDFADLRAGTTKGMFERFDMNMDKDCVNWEGSLAYQISNAFDVKLIQQKHPWVLMYCGTKTDIEISIYMFKYLRRSVGILSSRSFKRKADQTTFAYGMVTEIGRRLDDLYKKRNEVFSSDSRALMVIKTDGLAEFVREQFPRLTKGRRPTLTGSHEAHKAGVEAGRKVNISRPISGNGHSTQQLN